MKRFLIAVMLCSAFSWNCLAQNGDTPASKEDVERYLELARSHDMLNKMMDAMAKPMHQMVHDEYMKDKDKLPADFEERTNKKIDEMMKEMPWDDMIQAMVPSYQKHFTKEDLDSLVAFYSSTTGQKVLREMPEIMAEAMQSMMPIMRKHMEAVNQDLQQEIASAIKDSQKASSQTPSPQN